MTIAKRVSSSEAESEIRKAVEEFTRAYNAGEFAKLTDIFVEDLVDMSAGGPTRHGPQARKHFVARVQETHAKFLPHLEIQIDEIQVAEDWAYQRGSLIVELTPQGGGQKSFIKQRYLEIWRRQPDGQWKIAIEMDNSEDASN
jgi:uncharacterized protein (TIGR02246 family)